MTWRIKAEYISYIAFWQTSWYMPLLQIWRLSAYDVRLGNAENPAFERLGFLSAEADLLPYICCCSLFMRAKIFIIVLNEFKRVSAAETSLYRQTVLILNRYIEKLYCNVFQDSTSFKASIFRYNMH